MEREGTDVQLGTQPEEWGQAADPGLFSPREPDAVAVANWQMRDDTQMSWTEYIATVVRPTAEILGQLKGDTVVVQATFALDGHPANLWKLLNEGEPDIEAPPEVVVNYALWQMGCVLRRTLSAIGGKGRIRILGLPEALSSQVADTLMSNTTLPYATQ
jgi:hypothetical protein